MSTGEYFFYSSLPFVIVFIFLLLAWRKYQKQDSRNYSNDFIGGAVVFGCLLMLREDDRSVSQKLHWMNRYLRKRFPGAQFNVIQIYQDVMEIGVELPEYIDRTNERFSDRQKTDLMEFLVHLANLNGDINPRESEFIFYLLKGFGVDWKELDQSIQDLLFSRNSSRESEVGSNLQYYFQVLGLDPGADFQEVKNTYRKLVKIYHPDSNRNVSESEKKARTAKFLEIQQAYEMIHSKTA